VPSCLLPFQMSVLGYTTPSVSATNQLFNIVAIPSGVLRYVREGRMVWPLTWAVVAGTLPGVLVGAIIRVRYLPDPTAFKVFAGLVLLYIGGRMVRDLAQPGSTHAKGSTSEDRFHERVAAARDDDAPIITVERTTVTRIAYTFVGERFEVSTLAILSLTFGVGIVGGVYGIGGGAIVAPFFVSVLGLPVYTVAGAALMGTFVTSVAGVGFYQALAPFYPDQVVAPDWALGVLFGLGGAAGMYCGARLQKHLPGKVIKWVLAAIIVTVAARYLLPLFG